MIDREYLAKTLFDILMEFRGIELDVNSFQVPPVLGAELAAGQEPLVGRLRLVVGLFARPPHLKKTDELGLSVYETTFCLVGAAKTGADKNGGALMEKRRGRPPTDLELVLEAL